MVKGTGNETKKNKPKLPRNRKDQRKPETKTRITETAKLSASMCKFLKPGTVLKYLRCNDINYFLQGKTKGSSRYRNDQDCLIEMDIDEIDNDSTGGILITFNFQHQSDYVRKRP